MKIKLSQLNTTAGTQTREHLSDETVNDYAERMAEGDTFPPVTVFHDGTDHFLADGFHRVAAAQKLSHKQIDAAIVAGSRLTALEFSLGANINHGLRRTNKDKRNAVHIAFAEFEEYTDRAIAKLCGVSHKFVSNTRHEMEGDDMETPVGDPDHVETVSTSNPQPVADQAPTFSEPPKIEAPEPAVKKRTGIDGKQYTVKSKEARNAPSTAPESSVLKAFASGAYSSTPTEPEPPDAPEDPDIARFRLLTTIPEDAEARIRDIFCSINDLVDDKPESVPAIRAMLQLVIKTIDSMEAADAAT